MRREVSCAAEKLETPMEWVRPEEARDSRARQVGVGSSVRDFLIKYWGRLVRSLGV